LTDLRADEAPHATALKTFVAAILLGTGVYYMLG
jgi:hypothetical protein